MDLALVVARHGDRVMLVHNCRRDIWELPGGFVDAGESPEACARRELLEESGQSTSLLTPAVSFTMETPDGAMRHGLVFATALRQPAAFIANAEIDAIRFCRFERLPRPLSAIDEYIVRCVR